MAETGPFDVPIYSTDFWQNRELAVQRMVNAHDLPVAKNPNSVAAVEADLQAGFATYLNYGSLVALREGFLTTANRKTSVLVGAKSLGVRLKRKLPAKTEVLLRREDASTQLTINPLTQFLVDGNSFFCRHAINFPLGVSEIGGERSGLFLYSGEVYNDEATIPAGDDFQTIELAAGGFTVSDVDVIVLVNGKIWSRKDDAIFMYGPRDEVFMDDTSYEGKAQITFGNGLKGKKPSSSDSISIWYVITNGAKSNTPDSNLPVDVPSQSTVTGFTVSPIYNGQSEPNFKKYKFSAPLFARTGTNDNSASTQGEHAAFLADYQNVADVLVLGQRDLIALDPVEYNHPAYMNHLELIALPIIGQKFKDADKADMAAYLTKKSKVAREVGTRYDPEAIPVTVDVTLYLYADANLEETKAATEKAVRALYARGSGTLKRDVLPIDVSSAIRDAADKIDVIEVKLTGNGTDLKPYQYQELFSLSVSLFYTSRRKKE